MGLEIFAYVIMSNHIHLLARSSNGDLSGTIRDFKSFTTKRFLEIVNSKIESRSDWMKMVFLGTMLILRKKSNKPNQDTQKLCRINP